MAIRTGPTIKYGAFEFDPSMGFPVPQISLSTNANRSQAGVAFSYQTDVTLNGLIYGRTGWINDCDNNFSRDTGFAFLVDQAKLLQAAFVQDNQELLIECNFQGTPTILLSGGGVDSQQILRVNSIQFNESQDLWSITTPYSINLSVFSRSGITGSGEGYPDGGGGVGSGFLVSSIGDTLSITPETDKNYYIYDDTYPPPNKQTVTNQQGQTIIDGDFNNDLRPYENASGFPTYSISRTLSAQGLAAGTGLGDAVANAKEWCLWQATYQPIEALVSDLDLYNYTRAINSDAPAGSYSITDSYKAVRKNPSGKTQKWLETFDISQDTRNDGTKTVTINGTIEGLEITLPLPETNTSSPVQQPSDPLDEDPAFSGGTSGVLFPTHSGTTDGAKNTKYNNALSGWAEVKDQLYNRCITINPIWEIQSPEFSSSSTYWLNPAAINQRQGFSAAKGTVTFNATYDNRPLGLIPEASSERLDINDNYAVRSTANIFVIGRRLGPIKQDLGTSTVPTRRVSYSARFPRPISMEGYSFPSSITASIYNALEQFNPNKFNSVNQETYISVVKNDSFQFNPLDSSVSVTIEWEYTKCGVG